MHDHTEAGDAAFSVAPVDSELEGRDVFESIEAMEASRRGVTDNGACPERPNACLE
jgi:hypothetical protein